MVLADVLLGYVISRVLDKKSPTARPPLVVTPTTPTAPAYTPTAPATPTYTPTTPTPTVTPTPTAPPFPSGQIVPASNVTPAAGMKKAVEVWVVKPELQTVIVGMRLSGATSLAALEQSFPQVWQAAKVGTAAEINTAKSLLPKWKEGGVIFMGPATLPGRRAYRMTKHPATATQPTAVPVAAPAAAPTPAPSGIVPASYTPPAATPAPTAVPTAPKPPAAAPSPPQAQPSAATPAPMPATGLTPQVTTVRRGEGLANIAKRLGMPATATSAAVIQKANVPRGPDATWKAIAMNKGGLQKAGRNAGLQPGDRLWVPSNWGPYSASQL